MSHVFDHASASNFLQTRGNAVPRKKIANNTHLIRIEGTSHIGVMLHRTCILTYLDPATTSGGEMVVLNTGGWFSVTTKARMNDFLPGGLRVASDKGRWYVYLNGFDVRAPFNDGITLSRENGTWITDSTITDSDDEMVSLINKFIRNAYANIDNAAYLPDGRDALLNVLRAKPAALPRELLIAALETRGYRDPYLMLQVGGADAHKRALRSYLKAQLLTNSEGARPMVNA